ncbi:hypothetical protein C4553_00015 [Candidatus Parcubacteria bacterium]|nr:MAG: hypothetical protein C4553_00015 [Candidatus Parcubacteria bacterium]
MEQMGQEVKQRWWQRFQTPHNEFFHWLFIAVGGVFVLLLVWNILNGLQPQPDRKKVQAVFLTNGQVYFGTMQVVNRNYIKLASVYYLQVQQPVELQSQEITNQPNINIVKLGGEIHGPEDAMFIPQDRILFWENLREDSNIVKLIQRQ